MNIDWRRYLYQMAFALAVIGAFIVMLSISGCAWSSQTRTNTNDRSRIQGTAGGLPVDVVVERQVEAQEQTAGETRSPAIETMATAASQGVGVGGPVGGLLGLAGGALAAWFAAKPLLKNKDQQLGERDQRLDRLRIDRDEARARAEQYALKLPPTTMDDHA